MSSTVNAQLNQGIDSFIRVTSILRRKKLNVKELKMTLDDKFCSLNIILENEAYNANEIVNQISKLVDVEDIKLV